MQEVGWEEKGAKVIRNGYKLLWRSGSKAENGVGEEWKLLLGMRSGKLSCAIITHRLGGQPWKRRNYMKFLIGLWPGKKFLLVVTSIVILERRLVALVKFMEVMWLVSGMMSECVCVCVCVCLIQQLGKVYNWWISISRKKMRHLVIHTCHAETAVDYILIHGCHRNMVDNLKMIPG